MWLAGERVVDPANASTALHIGLRSGNREADLVAAAGLEGSRPLGRIAAAHAFERLTDPGGLLEPIEMGVS